MLKRKVLVALSGGVDSAVSAALLLRQGYQVEAAFMKNWSSTTGLVRNVCPWLEDRREALKVAAFLGIRLHTFDFEKEYQQKVMEYFFREYAAGRTPNPDVMCNKEIKFKLLYKRAMQLGFDYMATGHYTQIKYGQRPQLLKAKDQLKDQTYFIYNIAAEQLNHLIFPVGKYLKSEVRTMARRFHLPNADRKESMGLCFVGKIRLDEFLKQKVKMRPGPIVDVSGKLLGQHKGAAYYTLGQREGLGVGGTGPYYVVKKDIQANTVVVAGDPKESKLIFKHIEINGMHWITQPEKFPFVCQGRFRHQQELQNLVVDIKTGQKDLSSDFYVVKFNRPQRAVASGQSLVLYKGNVCLGGGVIV